MNAIYSNFEIRKRKKERKGKKRRSIASVGPREQHTVYIHTYIYVQFTLLVLLLGAMPIH